MPSEAELATLRNLFAHHPPATERKVRRHEKIRRGCYDLGIVLMDTLPESDERDEALKLLGDVLMMSNAAVARHDDDGERIYPDELLPR